MVGCSPAGGTFTLPGQNITGKEHVWMSENTRTQREPGTLPAWSSWRRSLGAAGHVGLDALKVAEQSLPSSSPLPPI